MFGCSHFCCYWGVLWVSTGRNNTKILSVSLTTVYETLMAPFWHLPLQLTMIMDCVMPGFLVYCFHLCAALVQSFSIYYTYIHYKFWPHWPSSSVQVGLTRQLLLPWVLFLSWYCAATIHVFNFMCSKLCQNVECGLCCSVSYLMLLTVLLIKFVSCSGVWQF
jgi:hypothetical protein